MRILVWLYVVSLLLILVGGALMVLRYAPGVAPQHGSKTARPGFVARVQAGFGRVSGCVLALAAGTGVIIAIVWPVGYGARNFDAQDHKVYNWVLVRAHTNWMHSAMSTLTKMSNNRESQVVAGAFMILLTLWWFRNRRGLAAFAPAVLIITAYELEHQLQHTLKLLAARTGPVPAGLGSFPSGGVARLISIYGLILYLVLRRLNLTRSKWAVGGWTILAAATYTESYSRLYLGKHWISDIFGGLVFGAILLAVLIAATRMLDQPDPGPHGLAAFALPEASDTPDRLRFAGSVPPPPRDDEPHPVQGDRRRRRHDAEGGMDPCRQGPPEHRYRRDAAAARRCGRHADHRTFGQGRRDAHVQTRIWEPSAGRVRRHHGQAGTGEPLVLRLRPGNAGSNTAADHIAVVKAALAQIPSNQPGRRPGRRMLSRTAGAEALQTAELAYRATTFVLGRVRLARRLRIPDPLPGPREPTGRIARSRNQRRHRSHQCQRQWHEGTLSIATVTLGGS